MRAIRATIRNGRVEPVEPLQWPEGAELLVIAPDDASDPDGAWDDSADAIAAWLAWYDSSDTLLSDTLLLTPDGRRDLDEQRAERRAWELANFNARADRLRDMWQ